MVDDAERFFADKFIQSENANLSKVTKNKMGVNRIRSGFQQDGVGERNKRRRAEDEVAIWTK